MSEPVPNENDQVADLFREVLELDPGDRAALYEQRGTPQSVRDEVESLLGEPAMEVFADSELGAALRDLPEAAPSVAWTKGTEVGDYEIVGEVARGGMGVVFEAKQRSLGRRVAIKVVRGADFSEAESDRFRAEAEAIARLEHSGIVPVYEVVEHEGLHFYSMPFLAGGSLKDLDLPLDSRRAARIVAEICDAIHYAHTQNIVHRDLKPANVLLTESLQPKVSDFGLAKDIGDDSDGRTRTGAILGTPGFMAPEQARGDGEAVGHLADVYGLGGILFYLLTDRVPIEGKNLVDTLHKIVHQGAPDVRRIRPGIEADLASICRKALEQDPLARYSSAAALAADLRRFVDGIPTEARPLRANQRLMRWCRRRPGLASLSLLLVLSLVGGGTTATLYAIDANEKATELASANQDLKSSNDELTEARADAHAFSQFLLLDVVGAARQRATGGIGVNASVREALLAALPSIGPRFDGRPVAEASARHEIGVTLRHVGSIKEAVEQLEMAFELRKRELGREAADTLHTWNSLGAAYYAANKFKKAAKLFKELLPLVEQAVEVSRLRVLRNLAECHHRLKEYDEETVVLQQIIKETEGAERAIGLANLALVRAITKRPGLARKCLAQVRALMLEQKVFVLSDLNAIERDMFECYVVLGDDKRMVPMGAKLLGRFAQEFGTSARETLYMAKRLATLPEERVTPRLALLGIEVLIRHNGMTDSIENRKLLFRAGQLLLQHNDLKMAQNRAMRAYEAWAADDVNSPQAFASEGLLCEVLIRRGHVAQAMERLKVRIVPLRRLVEKTRNAPPATKWRHKVFSDSLARFERLLAEK